MWFENRPLRSLSYGNRVGSPPCPAAWVVVYAKRAAGFPSDAQSIWLAGFYVLVCVWYGSLRELAARHISATRRHPKTFNCWRNALLRCFDTISNAATACCFLWFLVPIDNLTLFFPLGFFVSLTAHLCVEMEIAHRLRCIHSDHAYLGGRRPTTQELQALRKLGDEEEVTVVGIHN